MAMKAHDVLRGLARLTLRGLPAGAHVTRYAMYRELSAYAGALRRDGRTLAISHSRPLCDTLGIDPTTVIEANYPECDLLALRYADASFANIVTDQVLEHVGGDPKVAIDESLRVLVPGGVAVHTTCFINPVHDAPADYWRFTPEALRLLCRDYEVLGAGGWGNKWVWVVDALGLRFDPVPHSAWHPLHRVATHDDPTWPVVTWIVVRKAG